MKSYSLFPDPNEMDPQSLSMLSDAGQKLLQSGAVKPKDVQKTAKEMGFDLGMSKVQESEPYRYWDRPQMKADLQTPEEQSAVDTTISGMDTKQPKISTDFSQSAEEKNSNIQNIPLTMDEETFNKRMNLLSMMPAIQENEKASKELERSLPALIGNPDPNPWIKPMLAGIDTWTGGKMADAYSPGLSQKDRQLALLKYQDEIAKRKADTAREYLKGLSALKEGYTQTGAVDTSKQASGTKEVTDPNDPLTRVNTMIDARAYENLLRNVKNSPEIRKDLQSIQGLTNGFNLVDKLDITTPQQFNEAQVILRGISQGLGGAGTRSGVEERSSTYVQSAEKYLDSLIDQYGSNGLANVPQNDAQLVHFKQALSNARNYLSAEYQKSLKKAAGGHDTLLLNPKYASDFSAFMSDLQSQVAEPANMSKKSQLQKANPGYGTPSQYDGSTKLPNPTPAQAELRRQYLLKKAGQ